MKITDSDNIKNSEHELIDSLIGELDWEVIESILKEKYNLSLHDDVEYKKGDLIVHGNKIAYKLDFDVRVTLSLIVGRDGECFDIKASGSEEDEDFPATEQHRLSEDAPEDTADMGIPPIAQAPVPVKKSVRINEGMANQIADIINEINN